MPVASKTAKTSKPAAKTTPPKSVSQPKKTTGTALAPWEQDMANRAKKAAAQEVPFGSFKKIGIQGGLLKIDGELVEGNCLDIVVLAALHENQYYTEAFNPSVPAVPACYAFNDPTDEDGKAEDTMVAHAEAENPQGQESPDEEGANGNPCSGCWANRMGSADVGRGKACKNIRRLMVVTSDSLESAQSLADAEMRSLSVPVMSTNNWGRLVRHVAENMSRDYAGVVITLQPVPDPKSQFVLTFEFKEMIEFDQDLWDAMEAKRKEAMASLSTAYPKQADMEASKPLRPTGRAAQAMSKGKPAAKSAVKRGGKF